MDGVYRKSPRRIIYGGWAEGQKKKKIEDSLQQMGVYLVDLWKKLCVLALNCAVYSSFVEMSPSYLYFFCFVLFFGGTGV
jgi:hypothetical protein